VTEFAGFVIPEKNFFSMPNEWVDICAEIHDISELKVIQYVIRHTWGFREYGICKVISVDEFMQGRRRQDGSRMDKGTGLSEQSVRNGIKKAIDDGYLVHEIDTSDAGRTKKAYAVKMRNAESEAQTLDPPQTLDPLEFIPQGTKLYTPDSQSLDPRVPEFIPRTEKDTIERHYRKTLEEKQEGEGVADATVPAQIHISEVSQDNEEDTKKRRAFMAKVHKIVAQANNGTRTPATKVTIPKRPTQKPITMEPVIPDNVLAILDRWDSIHGKPAPRTPKAIQAAQLLTVCDPSAEDLKKCQDWLYTTDRPGKPWYRSHGVHLPDIAENIGKWQSLQDAPPQKSASNGHSPKNDGKMDYNAAIMDTSQNFIKATPESIAEDERRLAEKHARTGAKR